MMKCCYLLSLWTVIFLITVHKTDSQFEVNGETGESLTHGELRDRIHRLASALARLGVAKGDTVALISSNCPEFVLSFYATVLLGATCSTFNNSYTPSEIGAQLINSDSTVIICHENKLKDVRQCLKENKSIKLLLSIGEASEDILSLQKLIKDDDGKGLPTSIPVDTKEDVIVLPYSSGTTGLPKGVMLTHRNLVANMQQSMHPSIKFGLDATDDFQECFIGLLPLYHIYGLAGCMNFCLMTGSRLVTLKEFNQKTYVNAIRKHKATVLHLVPPLMNFLNTSDLASPDLLSHVRLVVCAAAPIGQSMLNDFFKKFGSHIPFMEGYGMTGTSPITHVSPKNNFILGSCGFAIPNTWSKIIDIETKKPIKPGEGEGELCIKGPQVMKGYYKNEKATRETIDEEGWLYTGDIAKMDENQNVFIVDRLKELIKVKGLQVAPAELENLLRKHPSIEDVAVIGIPDEKAGELPRAFVVLANGCQLTEKEVKDYVDKKVARHKRLDGGVEFRKEISKSASGKILRRELKKEFI